MLKFCSCFHEDFAYFGGFPTKDQFKELLDNDFRYFIDLTTLRERQRLSYDYSFDIPHHKDLFYLNFSIIDNNIPVSPKLFVELLDFISTVIQKRKKIYIHCKGGHGRSSLLVAAIYCLLLTYPPIDAFSKTKECHDNRIDLKQKYKGIPCPQLQSQRKFIINLYNNLKK